MVRSQFTQIGGFQFYEMFNRSRYRKVCDWPLPFLRTEETLGGMACSLYCIISCADRLYSVTACSRRLFLHNIHRVLLGRIQL